VQQATEPTVKAVPQIIYAAAALMMNSVAELNAAPRLVHPTKCSCAGTAANHTASHAIGRQTNDLCIAYAQ
jgi:hypothetical protein